LDFIVSPFLNYFFLQLFYSSLLILDFHSGGKNQDCSQGDFKEKKDRENPEKPEKEETSHDFQD